MLVMLIDSQSYKFAPADGQPHGRLPAAQFVKVYTFIITPYNLSIWLSFCIVNCRINPSYATYDYSITSGLMIQYQCERCAYEYQPNLFSQ